MRKFYIGLCLILVVFVVELPHPTFAASTLADTINDVVSNTVWSSDPAVISVGTIFGKTNLSAFDYASVSNNEYQWAWVREIALEDGYTSATIDANVKHYMAEATNGPLPLTDSNFFSVYDRYLITLYDLAVQWNMSSTYPWVKSDALTLLQEDIQANGGKPLLGFGYPGSSWYYAERYYDEWIEDLDIFLKMGDTATAATLWNGVNEANWNGQAYDYRPDEPSSFLEGEVGFFAAVVANYEMTVGSIPNFDRVSTDLYNKLLVSGWSSSLWGVPAVLRHATSNDELRLDMTAGAVEALQMYYAVSDATWRSAWVNLLTGSTPAWQAYVNNPLFGNWSIPAWNAEKAVTLFLYGIIPDTGSLAVPTNEWHYEDWTSMMPSTLFRFDYGSHTIRIPVFAGNIKFDFGSSIASYNFPSNGVYQVQFSSDWNSVTSASLVEGLNRFNFLSGGNSVPVHDIAIADVTSSKTVVGQGYNLTVNVAITNQGNFTETFSVTAYANDTVIDTQQVSTLNATDQTSLTFTWNTTGLAYGNYTLRVYAWPVLGEDNTADNNFTLGIVHVTIPGDIDDDLKVGLPDLVLLAQAYSFKLGDAEWNPNSDIDGDGTVGLSDLVILAQHYGQHYP
jgi:hypothetical protein